MPTKKETTRKKTAATTKPALRVATHRASVKGSKAAHAKRPEHDDPAAVDRLIRDMEHTLQSLVSTIRAAILKACPAATEGVKWNSPSFYLRGWFATVNTHRSNTVLVVLHCGAKPRDASALKGLVPDDARLLHWHSADRASIAFTSETEFASRRSAFGKIVKAWAAAQAQQHDDE
ncbi:MAG TPA: DUF1801 domain-containing protein [Phycisphaerales bacterium]|nr:DUF1801 domain-containing protein [Phycisphaerales bacterium]